METSGYDSGVVFFAPLSNYKILHLFRAQIDIFLPKDEIELCSSSFSLLDTIVNVEIDIVEFALL